MNLQFHMEDFNYYLKPHKMCFQNRRHYKVPPVNIYYIWHTLKETGTNWISSLSKYTCEKTYCWIEEFVQ